MKETISYKGFAFAFVRHLGHYQSRTTLNKIDFRFYLGCFKREKSVVLTCGRVVCGYKFSGYNFLLLYSLPSFETATFPCRLLVGGGVLEMGSLF